MKTLDQIEAAETAVREKAWRYQRTTDALLRARQAVEQLTPRVDAYTRILSKLDQVAALARELPPDVIGPGGARARDVIAVACSKAAENTSHRLARDQRQLATALESIPVLERQLADFND